MMIHGVLRTFWRFHDVSGTLRTLMMIFRRALGDFRLFHGHFKRFKVVSRVFELYFKGSQGS